MPDEDNNFGGSLVLDFRKRRMASRANQEFNETEGDLHRQNL